MLYHTVHASFTVAADSVPDAMMGVRVFLATAPMPDAFQDYSVDDVSESYEAPSPASEPVQLSLFDIN